jgi:hypothetical protein
MCDDAMNHADWIELDIVLFLLCKLFVILYWSQTEPEKPDGFQVKIKWTVYCLFTQIYY